MSGGLRLPLSAAEHLLMNLLGLILRQLEAFNQTAGLQSVQHFATETRTLLWRLMFPRGWTLLSSNVKTPQDLKSHRVQQVSWRKNTLVHINPLTSLIYSHR